MQSDDEDLGQILGRLPRTANAEQLVEAYPAVSSAVHSHADIIEEIFACLKNHSDLSIECQIFFDTARLHFHPYTGAMSLAAYAMRRGSAQAIEWYRRTLGTQSAAVRHAGLVSGLTTNDRIDFSNGVSILPLHSAGNAPQVLCTRQLSAPNPIQAILGSQFNAVIFKDAEYDRSDVTPATPANHAFVSASEDVLVGCILNEGLAPALIVQWDEFLDPDMRAAEVSWGTTGFPQEAPVTHGRPLDAKDVPNVELFLSLQGAFKERIRVALMRVGLARRKHSIANRAIEYSIALESLLSDGNTEMTHKISTRAAVILELDYDKRVKYRRLFKDLYKVRSRAVHGENVSQGDQSQVVNDSGEAISRLLLIATKRGKLFDFNRIDLAGVL